MSEKDCTFFENFSLGPNAVVAKLFVIFSECLHKCQLVSLEFQTLVKNIPDC
jgi:hypothetical protein